MIYNPFPNVTLHTVSLFMSFTINVLVVSSYSPSQSFAMYLLPVFSTIFILAVHSALVHPPFTYALFPLSIVAYLVSTFALTLYIGSNVHGLFNLPSPCTVTVGLTNSVALPL